jgi:hypothetical protein
VPVTISKTLAFRQVLTKSHAKLAPSLSQYLQKKICNLQCFIETELSVVKQLIAILFSVLLVWTPFVPAQALATCTKPAMNCCGQNCHMPCCAGKNSSDSQSAPAVPRPSTAQNQISLLAPSVVAWNLPQAPASFVSSASASPLLAMAAPLYARNCSLLL